MRRLTHDYFGLGIYSIPEASRLTHVSAERIRRWLVGRDDRDTRTRKRSIPVWDADMPRLGNRLALSFSDLIELRFVDAFLRAGVTWPVLREAHVQARELVGSPHPFCTNKFRTEGRHVFADMRQLHDEPGLIDVVKKQHYFDQIVRPILKDLVFSRGGEMRWMPLGRDREVVLDPRRSFGAPIVRSEGIPTSVLALAAKANSTLDAVREWHSVSVKSLIDAMEFEAGLAA